MNQSRLESAIEVPINTFIGFIVAVFSQIAIFPLKKVNYQLNVRHPTRL